MRWHKLRRTVSWLVRGWVLFAAGAVYGQEPALTIDKQTANVRYILIFDQEG